VLDGCIPVARQNSVLQLADLQPGKQQAGLADKPGMLARAQRAAAAAPVTHLRRLADDT
jgi:hypothetical protein